MNQDKLRKLKYHSTKFYGLGKKEAHKKFNTLERMMGSQIDFQYHNESLITVN
jgi:hypothetical protein